MFRDSEGKALRLRVVGETSSARAAIAQPQAKQRVRLGSSEA